MKYLTSGFNHWIFQRLSALLLLFFILVLLFGHSVNAFILCLIVVILHFKLGFETLFDDYTHDKKLKTIGLTLFRLVILFVMKFLFFIIIA